MSSRPFSLLLPLCFVSALALNAYAALDPTGVYQDYLEKLDAATPPVAAMATAAADGVYPWSEPKAPEPPPVPDPAPLPDPEPEPEPEEPDSPFTTVDASYFDDALFIGDSRMVNVANYARLGNADYFADVGMTVFKMFSTTASDKNFGATDLGSLLRSKRYSHIFVMLGLNEAGYPLGNLFDTYQMNGSAGFASAGATSAQVLKAGFSMLLIGFGATDICAFGAKYMKAKKREQK